MRDIPSWIGTEVGDRVGRSVGTVRDVYCDQSTSQPAWLLVSARDRLVLIPADGALSWSARVVVAHDRERIGAAPTVTSPPPVLAGEPLLRLARHYGVRVSPNADCHPVHGAILLAPAA